MKHCIYNAKKGLEKKQFQTIFSLYHLKITLSIKIWSEGWFAWSICCHFKYLKYYDWRQAIQMLLFPLTLYTVSTQQNLWVQWILFVRMSASLESSPNIWAALMVGDKLFSWIDWEGVERKRQPYQQGK